MSRALAPARARQAILIQFQQFFRSLFSLRGMHLGHFEKTQALFRSLFRRVRGKLLTPK